MLLNKTRLFSFIIGSIVLLFVPFIAMQLTNEVNWDVFDFTIAGILFIGVSVALEMILSNFKPLRHRIVIIGLVLFVFVLLWAELAVGLFGSPVAGS